MRNIILHLAAVATLLGTTTAVPTVAMAAANTDTVDFCKDRVVPPPAPKDRATLGECVSIFTTSDEGFAAHLCDYLIESGQIDMKFSDCVKAYRDGTL